MKVDFRHPEYDKFSGQWQRCRDAIEGEDSIKKAASQYLPQLTGQTTEEYGAYKTRALFYGASNKTVKGLAGAIMRRPPSIQFPDSKGDMLERIGAGYEPVDLLAKQALEEVLAVGRVGMLVDTSREGGDPYVTIYFAENIINWREEWIGESKQLTLVVLLETNDVKSADDPFVMTTVTQYRVLRLVGSPPDLQYVMEVYEERREKENNVEKKTFVLVESIIPAMRGGKPLGFIPFVFCGPNSTCADVEKAPILDLVNVNLSHYRTSADLEHGRHFTALPTAWACGFDVKSGTLTIGSTKAWVSDNPNARAGFLEFTGAGLNHLANALTEKERLMAVLGARMLDSPRAVAEAADTIRMRQAGEHSVLSNIARSVSSGFTKILYWLDVWTGQGTSTEEPSLILNQDYDALGADPAKLQILFGMFQSGALSWDALYYNMERGEIYPPNWSKDEEQKLIQKINPGFSGSSGEPETEPKPEKKDQERNPAGEADEEDVYA